jgi:hypothetical protein
VIVILCLPGLIEYLRLRSLLIINENIFQRPGVDGLLWRSIEGRVSLLGVWRVRRVFAGIIRTLIEKYRLMIFLRLKITFSLYGVVEENGIVNVWRLVALRDEIGPARD